MIVPIAMYFRFLSSLSLALSLPSSDDPVRTALQTQVNHFSNLVRCATSLVAMGLACEGIELIHDAVTWRNNRRSKKRELSDLREVAAIFPGGDVEKEAKSSPDHPKWVKQFSRVGLFLVVIGVIGEWRYGAELEDSHNAIHEYDVGKLTAAEKEAGDAATSAKTAHEELDAVKTEADALKIQLDATSKQLGVFAQRLPFRTLSTSESKNLAQTLRPFAGQQYLLYEASLTGSATRDPEISAFAERLNGALAQGAANWACLTSGKTTDEDLTGVIVRVFSFRTSTTDKAADALVSWLNKHGRSAKKVVDGRIENPTGKPVDPKELIEIIVAKRI